MADKQDKATRRRARKEKRAARARRLYRIRQRGASIYFLLWAAFSALSLVIVLLFAFSQRMVTEQTYKNEAARELSAKGKEVQTLVTKAPPEAFGGNRSAYLRYLSTYYDVNIFILSPDGELLFPQAPDFGAGIPEEQTFDFTDEVKVLLSRLQETESASVVYEGEGEYVYGAEISLYGDSEMYLYVAKSLALMEATQAQMGVRTVLLAVFVFALSFAVSSAVSGWLVKPLTEMTEKARLLAHGDFDVDFYGNDYYGREVTELAHTLNFARDELSKADSMQKELIANVSHDFKTPLTMIKAYASMIIEISGDNPEKRNKHAQVIVDEADRLASLVNDVLDLSKIRSGIARLEWKEIDLSSYVQEILERFAYLREAHGYVFQTEIDEDVTVRADELKIGQALYNLIGNAVNYTGEDKKVFVTLKKRADKTARFAVTDTGAGIKAEELSTIWDRYYRSSETHKRPVKGTGLGLSIVKTVLERHNLVFGVESEVGKGSTFYVDFPIIG